MHYSISLAGIGNRINCFITARRTWPDAMLWWPQYTGPHGLVPYFEELFEPRDFVIRTIGPDIDYSMEACCYIQPVKRSDPKVISKRYGDGISAGLKQEIINILSLFKPADDLKSSIEKKEKGYHIRTWYDTNFATPAKDVIRELDCIDLSQTYVACDNTIVQKWLYNNNYAKLEPSRSTQRAVIDLFSLANCSELKVHRHSTFSELAFYFGGAKAKCQLYG